MIKPVITIFIVDANDTNLMAAKTALVGTYKTFALPSTDKMFKLLEKITPDLILLDIDMPEINGLNAIKKIKEFDKYRSITVIMTTAKCEDVDIIAGLELGADDYVVKPYNPKILIATIKTGLRRHEENGKQTDITSWQQGELKLDTVHHTAYNGSQQLDLFATEFALLKHFLSNPEIVFSRSQIIAAIRGPDYPVTDRSIDVQILGLRKKLGKAGDMIETIRGVGYRFRVPE